MPAPACSRRRRRKGFVLMSALSPEQRATATIGMNLPFDVMATAFHDNDVMPYQGIRYGDMTREQRELLERLLGLYTGAHPAGPRRDPLRRGEAPSRRDLVRLDRPLRR